MDTLLYQSRRNDDKEKLRRQLNDALKQLATYVTNSQTSGDASPSSQLPQINYITSELSALPTHDSSTSKTMHNPGMKVSVVSQVDMDAMRRNGRNLVAEQSVFDELKNDEEVGEEDEENGEKKDGKADA